MSKYRSSRIRVIRRLGEIRSITQKKLKRQTRPGQHGFSRKKKKKKTQFFYHLEEKQKLRFHYGISEKQLIRYVKSARKRRGSTGQRLLRNLEKRLDNIVYQLGWTSTLFCAQQLVSHGHILVNKKCVNVPSFSCFIYSIIKFYNINNTIVKLIKNNLKIYIRKVPTHLSLNIENLAAVVNQDIFEVPPNFNELLVIEYYSNRI